MLPSIGKVPDNYVQISFVLTAALLLWGTTEISFANSFSTRTLSYRKTSVVAKNDLDLQRSRRDSPIYSTDNNDCNDDCNDGILSDRRDLLKQSLSSSILAGATLLSNTAIAWNIAPETVHASTDVETVEGFEVFKTDSGLKYIDLEVGTVGDSSKTPQYGQLCVISYTGYLQLPKDQKKTKFASQASFVLKHGNGKLIAGLDEGLHTMKRGGRRRLIIPPKLGFVADGLGPIPEMPWQRDSLNRLLTQMVEQRGGNLIYDIQLDRFFDDEADQGYYQDDEISPEEFSELNRRLNKKNGALDSVGDDIEVMDRDREKPIV